MAVRAPVPAETVMDSALPRSAAAHRNFGVKEASA